MISTTFLVALSAVADVAIQAEAPSCERIIEQAIEARGGLDQLTKLKCVYMKGKGKKYINGRSFDYSYETWSGLPSCYKGIMTIIPNDEVITETIAYIRGKGWRGQAVGREVHFAEMSEAELATIEETSRVACVLRLYPLLQGKAYSMSRLDDIELNGRILVGIRVKTEGGTEVDLFFDKESKLPAMYLSRNAGSERGERKEVYSDYRRIGGLVVAMKSTFYEGGVKRSEEVLSEYKCVEKLDETAFAIPDLTKLIFKRP